MWVLVAGGRLVGPHRHPRLDSHALHEQYPRALLEELNLQQHSITQNPFAELSKNFVGLRADQTFFEYKRCAKCNLCFAPRYFSADELELVYKNMPPNLVGDEQKIVEKTHEGYVKHIKKNLSSANSLIELGADLGLVTGPVVKHFNIKIFSVSILIYTKTLKQ